VAVDLGVDEPFAPARTAHPAFLVRGLDALRERLVAAGAEVDAGQPPLQGLRRIHAFDPFGNRLEFLEPDPPR